ncbi:GNAT family N-acetyltransferase [Leifsonia sp. NCR5]|uniref:GNAT family N-acetyltransferase n=1 Tax=Leifsonia sp. NCR5 TaxID=1978342 RepID=UPI000A1981DE|nr:GNAT family N-acetyltransferase [Leifsonia sp. NCR5]
MSIEVLAATGRWDDFATFMVPRKPGGGGCVCMSYRDARLGMPERIEYMKSECSAEPGPGVLVYLDGEVAGWCSVAPKSTYRRLMNSRTIPHLDEERDPWSIVCFVVRGGYRKRGLMHDLLDGAVEHARASGAAMVEGYPVDSGGERVDMISGYVGTVALFEKHGFSRVQATDAHSGATQRWVMRRELG